MRYKVRCGMRMKTPGDAFGSFLDIKKHPFRMR